jgi:hypothetical protein
MKYSAFDANLGIGTFCHSPCVGLKLMPAPEM